MVVYRCKYQCSIYQSNEGNDTNVKCNVEVPSDQSCFIKVNKINELDFKKWRVKSGSRNIIGLYEQPGRSLIVLRCSTVSEFSLVYSKFSLAKCNEFSSACSGLFEVLSIMMRSSASASAADCPLFYVIKSSCPLLPSSRKAQLFDTYVAMAVSSL